MASILMIDDDELFQNLVKKTLRETGYNAFGASSGKKALRVLEHFSVDLIITNVRMPDMNYLDLVAEIRKRGNQVPVIILSAVKLPDDEIQAGCISLQKPISQGDFEETIAKTLAESSKRREEQGT